MKKSEKTYYSGIGGQAVLDGIMMRNKNAYAISVRKEDGSIVVSKEEVHPLGEKYPVLKLPLIRGAVSFFESLILGIKIIGKSATLSGDEDEPMTKKDIGISLLLGILLAVGLFILLPLLLAEFLGRFISSTLILNLLEGCIRLLIFLGYVILIGRVPDIKKTYQYHGSEHKCINCIEHGLPLTIENVRKSSKEHRRCGTSFLLIVMLLSILIFTLISFQNPFLKFLIRILMIPVIAGISYEILSFTGKHDNFFTYLLSRPGMWMQGLTTKEPTDDMIEVAIRAVTEVFDWEGFLSD